MRLVRKTAVNQLNELRNERGGPRVVLIDDAVLLRAHPNVVPCQAGGLKRHQVLVNCRWMSAVKQRLTITLDCRHAAISLNSVAMRPSFDINSNSRESTVFST